MNFSVTANIRYLKELIALKVGMRLYFNFSFVKKVWMLNSRHFWHKETETF